MTKIKIPDLKKRLKEYNQKELVNLITDLYKLDKTVQAYLSAKFLGEEAIESLFEKAKAEIENEFFPTKGHGKIRLVVAKSAISQFEKLTKDQMNTIELMLFYVDNGTAFTKAYGDIDAKFYNCMASMYQKVIAECEGSEELFEMFADWLLSIVEDSKGTGWGYHDVLADLYYSLSWLEKEDY